MKLKIAVIVAVNDEQILKNNLLKSSLFQSHDVLFIKIENAKCAGHAYNKGITKATGADLIIFAHQDVYLPENWCEKLISAYEDLNNKNIKWGVLGLFGKKTNGERLGLVWDSGLNRELGKRLSTPSEVQVVDELLLVINNLHSLRFDESLPGFHFYGADICAQAAAQDLKVYVIDAPAVHNSKRHRSLGGSYAKGYRYMQKKWNQQLPIQAICSNITKFGIGFYRIRYGLAYRRILGLLPKINAGMKDPKAIAKSLDYE